MILQLLGNETIHFNTRGKKSEPDLRKELNIANLNSLLDRVSVPSPIAIDILMDTMARDRVHMYLFFV